ncbi:MAG: AraC family transcriptional regulator, partial [Eubacteriales bacterium]|nr:AraC family transcriptional regulator [Eubacteriales bacterium]
MQFNNFAEIFENSTGIQTVTKGQPFKCGMCSILNDATGMNVDCAQVVENSCSQANRFGGKYITFCPYGLVHFATSSYAGGGFLLVPRDDFFEEEICVKYNLTNEQKQDIQMVIDDIPYIQPHRVSCLSALLSMVQEKVDGVEAKDNLQKLSQLSDSIETAKITKNTYPIDTENQLLMAVSDGNKAEAKKLLNDMCGHIFVSAGGDLEIVKARVLELIVVLSRGAISGGAVDSKIFDMNFNFINKITHFDNTEELVFWFWEVFGEYMDSISTLGDIRHRDAIEKAVDYINDNLDDKLTLERVAEHVYLSTTYFSRVFNQEMGQSFNGYLNKVRIDKAKALLLHGDKTLADISATVGFIDQSYFTKVFKKYTGMTPNEFKTKKNK